MIKFTNYNLNLSSRNIFSQRDVGKSMSAIQSPQLTSGLNDQSIITRERKQCLSLYFIDLSDVALFRKKKST